MFSGIISALGNVKNITYNDIYSVDIEITKINLEDFEKSDNLIKKIVCNSIIGECVSKLMGWKGARLLQDNVLWKPPLGRSLLFHQDASYDDWITPQTMVTCWMPLDDSSIETGTLEYVVGSHKWDLCPPSGTFHAPDDYKKELKMSSAGHEPPLILNQDGNFSTFDDAGPPLGIMAKTKYNESILSFDKI